MRSYPHGVHTVAIAARVAAISKAMPNDESLHGFRDALSHGILLFKRTPFRLTELANIRLPQAARDSFSVFDTFAATYKPRFLDRKTRGLLTQYMELRRL